MLCYLRRGLRFCGVCNRSNAAILILALGLLYGCQTWQQFWGPVISSLSPTALAEGDDLTVNGYQLGGFGAVRAYLGGKECTIITASETSLTLRVPVGAVSGKLEISARGATAVSESEISVERYVLFATNNAGNIYGSLVDSASGTLATAVVTGTGGTTNGAIASPKSKILYVSTGFNNVVRAYNIDKETGGLTTLSGSPFSIGGIGLESGKIGIDPQGRFLYIFDLANNGPISFQLSSAGVPTPQNTVTNTALATQIISNRSGTHLYAANGSDVNFMAVNQTNGSLGTASTVSVSGSTNEIAFDPSGSYLFGTRASDIFRADVGANGALSGISGVAGTSASSSLAISESGKCLFTVDSTTTTIRPYAVAGTTLTAKTTATMSATAIYVRLTPNDKYLYSYASSGALGAFKVQSDCTLATISGSFTTGSNSNSMVFARLAQ